MSRLSRDFVRLPIAHRALHDLDDGRPENSISAIRAAIRAGYGIEVDLQFSKDGVPMVFHDYDLGRLTNQSGPLRQRNAADLTQMTLLNCSDTIPTLTEVLDLVAGQVPLLLEIKDQDGALGPDIGAQERAIADALVGYDGPAALMSFNPHSVIEMSRLCPHIPRGLLTCNFPKEHWKLVPESTLEMLRDAPDYDRSGASFISHFAKDLDNPRVAELRAKGATILSWTIKSQEEEITARKVADGITFEGYAAKFPT